MAESFFQGIPYYLRAFCMMIRPEIEQDIAAIRDIVFAAFENTLTAIKPSICLLMPCEKQRPFPYL
jgi:hypothetical protein